jgi:hypothetical protein
MSKAKEILLDELNEQGHPEKVEDVELSTDHHWRINYIKCCVPLILER